MLGHPHHEVLKIVLTKCNILVPMQSKLDFYVACCLGKLHRLPSFPSTSIYKEPFDLLFADMWDPAPMISLFSFKYLLTCVDAFIKYT